jgi:hypothetical protein
MTKRPNKAYYRPNVYLPKQAEELVDKAAADAGMTDSAWIVSLIETALGVDFGMRKQKPHGHGKHHAETAANSYPETKLTED